MPVSEARMSGGKSYADPMSSAGTLPRIHRLTQMLSLTTEERFCFYVALLSDYDRKYERIYGYIQDNVAARRPTMGLAGSLYGMGEEDGKSRAPIRSDSVLWRFLLEESRPGEGESRLSRPLAVREEVYRYLQGEGWLGGWWDSFACLEGNMAGERPSLKVSFSGLLDAYGQQEEKGRKSIWAIVTTLALAARVEEAEIFFTCPSAAPERKEAGLLMSCIRQAGLGEVRVNELGPCAVRVPCAFGWEDLIIDEAQKELMLQICAQIKYRSTVEKWGFLEKTSYGNGISAVFYGSPGTGKTMAAQVMGRELGLDLYKIDLSQLVSKYIGETEKNLNQLFDRAMEHRAILFFDEADGLFAKRSSVENSNDRYANMETGYLLQKFEEYDGIIILATNFIHNIDDAFKRRIKFFVRFTFPDQKTRLKLWKSILPEKAQVDEPLMFEMYASRFELSGSDIRFVLTNAAYAAASASHGIRNEDIGRALKIHYLKLGRKLDDREII